MAVKETNRFSANEQVVFPGFSVIYFSSHTQEVTLPHRKKQADWLETFHCRKGWMECHVGENSCYIAPSDLLIARSNGIIFSFGEKGRRIEMQDFIIIAVIVVIAVFGLRSAIAHFKGQGGCCGGGGYKPKKKKLSRVKYRKTFHVEGMHCEHCKNRVEEVVNDLPGVAGKVDLKQGLLTVSYAEDVADETIKARLERAGYHVI